MSALLWIVSTAIMTSLRSEFIQARRSVPRWETLCTSSVNSFHLHVIWHFYIFIYIWSLKHRQNSLIGNDGQQSCSCGRHGGGCILAFRESNDVLLRSCSTVERPRRELHLTFYQLPEQINMNRPRLAFQQVVSLKKNPHYMVQSVISPQPPRCRLVLL